MRSIIQGSRHRDPSPTPSRLSRGSAEEFGDARMQGGAKVNRGIRASVRRTKERLFGNSTSPTNKHDFEDELCKLAGALRAPQHMLESLRHAVNAEMRAIKGLMASFDTLSSVSKQLDQDMLANCVSREETRYLVLTVTDLETVIESIEGKNMQLERLRENLKARNLLATDFRYYKRKLETLEEERTAAEAADPPKPVDEDRLIRNKAKFLRIKEELVYTTKALIGEISSIAAVGKAYVRPEVLTVARITAHLFEEAAAGTHDLLEAPEATKTFHQLNVELLEEMRRHSTSAIMTAQRVHTSAEAGNKDEVGGAMLRDYASRSPGAPVLQGAPPPQLSVAQASPPRSPRAGPGAVRPSYAEDEEQEESQQAGQGSSADHKGPPPPLPSRNGGGVSTGPGTGTRSHKRSESESSRESRATEFQIVRPTEIDPVIDTVVVEHSYTAEGPEELTIVTGDQVQVMQKDASGWWRGQRVLQPGRAGGNSGTQQTGWFPASHIQS